MTWWNQSEFKNFRSCRDNILSKHDEVNQKIKLTDLNKSLELRIIDACEPWKFQNQKTKILVTNNWISADALDSTQYEQFSASWCAMYAGIVPIEKVTPTKNFNCFINRMDTIRQSWLYQLIRRGIFEQGYVSFNMDIALRTKQILKNEASILPLEIFEKQFCEQLSIFESEHNFIKSQIPYRNFDADILLDQIIMQSKFSIVLETYFDRNNVITYSEKIFRCLKLPRPWVMFAMKNAVQNLRDKGFDVLDDLVDHSYDTIEFDVARQVAILDQIEIMCKNQLTTSMILRCEQAAKHNQQLLFKLLETFYEDVNSTYERASTKCLQL
jgi:hypothetical protein